MSREQYIPPSLTNPTSQTSNQNAAASSSSGAFNLTGSSADDDITKPVKYICGECDAKMSLKKGDGIRCKDCGYRVLYKERTNRMIQFEAR